MARITPKGIIRIPNPIRIIKYAAQNDKIACIKNITMVYPDKRILHGNPNYTFYNDPHNLIQVV